MMVKYGGNYYTYLHSLQGDILAIVDSAGAKVVEYKYDAWGKPVGSTQGTLAATLGKLNPFRYRGYLFDEETGLYYLRSRYYNPEWGRFINSDRVLGKVGGLSSHNVFAYAFCNPINFADSDGNFAFFLATALVGAVIGAVAGGVIAAANGEDWRQGVLIGAAVGGLIGLGAGAAAGVLLAGSATASTGAVIAGASVTVAVEGVGLTGALAKTVDHLVKNAEKLQRTATVMNNAATRAYINSTLTIQLKAIWAKIKEK